MASKTKVRLGGVMRCCLDHEEWPEDPEEGDLLDCPHGCEAQLVYHKGAWEWYSPDHPLRSKGDNDDR